MRTTRGRRRRRSVAPATSRKSADSDLLERRAVEIAQRTRADDGATAGETGLWRRAARRSTAQSLPSAVERQAPDGVVSHRGAQHESRERRGKVDRGWSRPKPLLCSTFADAWSDERERRRHWKPSTTVASTTVLERLAEFFGPMKLAEIRPRHAAKYLAERSRALRRS
jgi:hypothetical protein